MTPWDAVGNVIVGIYKEKKAQRWVTLIFQMSLSACVTFSFVCGSSLIASRSFAVGIGSGMVSAAIVVVYFFRRSDLTKGMMLVAPSEEAVKEMDSNLQVIQK